MSGTAESLEPAVFWLILQPGGKLAPHRLWSFFCLLPPTTYEDDGVAVPIGAVLASAALASRFLFILIRQKNIIFLLLM